VLSTSLGSITAFSASAKAFQDKSFLQMDVSRLSLICHEAFFPLNSFKLQVYGILLSAIATSLSVF